MVIVSLTHIYVPLYFQVDMPVFFYIDPEFADDPNLITTNTITLSYTFFEAKDGMELPLPGYMRPQPQ